MLPNFTATFGSLVPSSPVTTALDQANRQAQRYLEDVGAVSAHGRTVEEPTGFVLPSDVDPVAAALVVEMRLLTAGNGRSGRNRRVVDALEKRQDGRIVVPAEYVRRLGEGDYDRSKQLLGRIVGDIRVRRAMARCRGMSS